MKVCSTLTSETPGFFLYNRLMWTKERIINLLNTNDIAVERAIVAIYNRQTADEKNVRATRHDNSMGFRANHAHRGSYYAEWIRSGRHLTGDHIRKARKIVLHYHRQLLEIANAKK